MLNNKSTNKWENSSALWDKFMDSNWVFIVSYVENDSVRLLWASSRHFSTNIINSEGSESKFKGKNIWIKGGSNTDVQYSGNFQMNSADAERWFNVLAQVVHFQKEWFFNTKSFIRLSVSCYCNTLVELTPNNMFLHKKVQGLNCLAKIYYRKHMTRDDILSCKGKTESEKYQEIYLFRTEMEWLRKFNTFSMLLSSFSHLQAFQVQYIYKYKKQTCVGNISLDALKLYHSVGTYVVDGAKRYKFIIRMRLNGKSQKKCFLLEFQCNNKKI